MAAPITVSFPLSGGPVTLEDKQPNEPGVQPGGLLAVMVVPFELATEWPISAPRPVPANGPTISAAFHGDGTGDWRDVPVGEIDRHRLQVEFAAAPVAAEFVDLGLNQRACGNYNFVAGGNRRSDLRVDVVSAVNIPALNGMCEHERDVGSGWHCDSGDDRMSWRDVSAGLRL
jgi:hypothetical protein